ncbi:MAG: TraR/DksA family transcriptional regulator [Rhodoglobus sp.]
MSAELTSSQAATGRPLTTQQQARMRARLVDDLQQARELEARLQHDVADGIASRRGSTNDEVDDPEGANTAFEGAQSNAMVQHTRRHIDEILAAMVRLDDGSYGSCERCGSAVSKARLDARPATAFCISCAA